MVFNKIDVGKSRDGYFLYPIRDTRLKAIVMRFCSANDTHFWNGEDAIWAFFLAYERDYIDNGFPSLDNLK